MKRFYRQSQPAVWLLGGTALTDLAVWLVQATNAWPFKVAAFVGLSVVPGAALLRSIRAEFVSPLERLLYVFGLSVLGLMLSTLAANQLLFSLGVRRPLQLVGIWASWNVLCLALVAAAHMFNHSATMLPLRLPRFRPSVMFGVLCAALLPCLAALGAFRLNNGGNAAVAMAGLCFAALLMVSFFALRRRLPDGAIAWFIFCLGLAVLLMTSLRSWDITGHDIAREFQVYTLTHTAAHWNIGADHDAYNACLSITILPEAYVKLLHVSGVTAFKLLLQIIFAACPVAIYVLLRRQLGKLGALAGCMLFMSYPTFINDSAMLTRQGVAYLFFALAVLVVVKKQPPKARQLHTSWPTRRPARPEAGQWSEVRVRRLLFLLCALGVIFSHYSTTYMFVALFVTAVICKSILKWLPPVRRQFSSIGLLGSVLTPSLALLLTLGAFMWFAQATASSGGLTATLEKSITNLPHMLSNDNRSSDTSASLVFSSNKTQLDVFDAFMSGPKQNSRLAVPQNQPILTDDDLPLTALGKALRSHGIDPGQIAALRQYVAKLLQIMALLGVGYSLYVFVKHRATALSFDYICICLAGLLLLGCIVALPTISLNYGILRAFQQSLIFLLVPMVLLPAKLLRRLKPRVSLAAVSAAMALLFLVFTGAVAQLLGGSDATLTLNNRGLYYGLYYTTAADLRSYAWMQTHIRHSLDVRAASYSRADMHSPNYPFSRTGILPMQLQPGSYVYLDQAQLVAGKFYTYYQGTSLITTFPLDYFNTSKNLIYTTGTTGVYR